MFFQIGSRHLHNFDVLSITSVARGANVTLRRAVFRIEVCLRILLISVLIGQTQACVTPPTTVAPPVAPPIPAAPESSDLDTSLTDAQEFSASVEEEDHLWAEPIAPATHKMFAHLRPFEGHILLGSATVQVVLAGVPAQAPTFAWQPSILAFFEKTGNHWRRLQAIGAVDLQRRDAEEKFFYAIGLDLGVERTTRTAVVTLTYATNEAKTNKQQITYRLDVAGGVKLRLSFDQHQPDATTADPNSSQASPTQKRPKSQNPGRPASLWTLRLRQTLGHLAPNQVEHAGSYLLSYLMSSPVNDVLALLADQDFSRTFAGDDVILRPKQQAAFEFLIGHDAALQLPTRLPSGQACRDLSEPAQAGASPDSPMAPTPMLANIAKCSTAAQSGTVRLTLEARSATSSDALPVYVFDDYKQVVAYTTVSAKQPRVLTLPSGRDYILANNAQGRTWKSILPVHLTSGQSHALQLPAPQSGKLTLKSRDQKPAVVVIRAADGNASAAAITPNSPAVALKVLAAGVFAVLKWPVTFKLSSQSYEVLWFNPPATIRCRQLVNIDADRTAAAVCTESLPPSPSSSSPLKLLQVISRSDQPPEVATLAAPSLDLLAPLVALTATDPQSELQLTWLGATSQQSTEWQALKTKPLARGQTLLSRFLAYVRGQPPQPDNEPILELGCPPAGLDLQDYINAANKFAPQAIQLFGCPTLSMNDGFAPLLASLQTQRDHAYALTSVPTWASLTHHSLPTLTTLLPWLATSEPQGTAASKLALAALRDGRVGASAGVQIERVELTLTKIAPSPVEKHKKIVANSGTIAIELQVDLSEADAVTATEVVLYTESDWTATHPISESAAAMDQPMVRTTGSFAIPTTAEWLRIEIRGRSAWSPCRAQAAQETNDASQHNRACRLTSLATTSFMRIADLLHP